jgi:hypothetical protein
MIETQDALFMDGKSMQEVRNVNGYFLLAEHLFFEFRLLMIQLIKQ